MEENKVLLEQENIKKFLHLLEENGMTEQKKDFEFIAGYVDQMEFQFNNVLDELKNVRQELNAMQDKTIRATATRAIDKVVSKAEDGKNYVLKLKNHIKHTVDKAVTNFKEQGKSALVSAMKTLNVKGLLESIKGGLFHATQSADHGINNLTKLGNEIHAVNSHLKNVGRVIVGKEVKESSRNSEKGVLFKVQESLFFSMDAFTKMSKKTEQALSKINKIESKSKMSVKSELGDIKKQQTSQTSYNKIRKDTELGQR